MNTIKQSDMKKNFDEISVMFSELIDSMKHLLTDAIEAKNGLIILSPEQTTSMKYYTGYEINEIGIGSKVSGGLYVKYGGTLTAINCLGVNKLYNILWQLNRMGFLKNIDNK